MNRIKQFLIETGASLTTLTCYYVMHCEKTGVINIEKENVYFFCMFACLNYIHSCIKFYSKERII